MSSDHNDDAATFARVFESVARQMAEQGADPDAVLAGLHGIAVTLIAATYGGAVAAERCRAAAKRVEATPRHPAADLAQAPCAGRA